ncbi:InlB B-repeat-containing protein [Isobaculum melis]|uniref:LPXTG-motif cell wall anchor domain-containing protein/Listeria/Bacterioides repeat-containing protein n=1 Tax=Isobaculum melis TaxID=142588 RepID=A0A1H9STY8_9LACT|nr:InlB B-repeat-containing protein [Isobaculum melis]SER88436.1 LPXTG-motif cell wall anchor domain-containing protein/Listeria/Bacterioides repeat-containing protein [Isobaculum melis]
MKKNIFGKLLMITAIVSMVCTQTGILTYANENEEQIEGEVVDILPESEMKEEKPKEEKLTEEEVNHVEEDSVDQQEEPTDNRELPILEQPKISESLPLTKDEEQPIINNSVVPYAAGFASFDGTDLFGQTNLKFNFVSLSGVPRILKVDTKFSSSGTVTNRKVRIKIGEGLAITSAPGLVNKGSVTDWTFDSSTLPTQLQGVLINGRYQVDAPIYGKSINSGVLEYEIAQGTTSVQFEIPIKLDLGFSLFEKSRDFNQAIEVQSTYEEAGQEHIADKESLEKLTIDGNKTTVSAYIESKEVTAMNGDSLTFAYKMLARGSGFEVSRQLVKEAKYTIKIPKGLTFEKIKLPSGTNLKLEQLAYTIDKTTDPNNTLVILTLKEFSIGLNMRFDVEVTVNEEANPDTTLTISGTGTSQPYGVDTAYPGGFSSQMIRIVGDFENKLTVSGQDINFSKLNSNEVTDYAFLGNFVLANQQPREVTNQSLRLTFDDSHIGVKSVHIPTAIGGKAENIRIKTTKGNIKTIASRNGVPAGEGNAARAYISLATLDVTDPDEFISELTYDIPSLPSGYKTSNGWFLGYTHLAYYGRILKEPENHVFSAKVSIVDKADGDFDSENAVKAISHTTIKDGGRFGYQTSHNFSKSSHFAGSEIDLSATFYHSGYVETGTNSSYLVKGFEVYLREGDYLQISKNDIVVKWGKKEYRASDGSLLISESKDNQGNKVYKLLLPDVLLGYGAAEGANQPNIQINYKAKIKTNAPTISIPTGELVLFQPINKDILSTAYGRAYNTDKNKFNVDGSGDTNKLIGVLNTNTALSIKAQQDFTVTSAANINDGPWVSYDYETDKEILDLNPSGNTKYQLTVANNSGNTIKGYTALIPIPKDGEKTNLTPKTVDEFDPSEHLQKEAFSWTASILSPVSATGLLSYKITYATTYETDKDSPKFKAWNEIATKEDIRMVKIETPDNIADGQTDNISFPLALTDEDADKNAGNINIYSARIYRELPGTTGYKPSEPIAIRLQTGAVKGLVFDDKNRNGIQDAGELGRNGVTVLAYKAGTKELITTTTTAQINGIAGSYEFIGLDKKQKVDIVFVNPTNDDSIHFAPVTTNGSTPTANKDHTQATTTNLEPSSTNFDKINAGFITPIKITLNPGIGSTANPIISKYPNDTIKEEPEAVLTGHSLKGWYTAATNGNKVSFPYTAGTADTTLYAQYEVNQYQVTYDVEGSTQETAKVDFDSVLTEPTIPTKTGYTFDGWYDAAKDGNKWDFTTGKMPAKEMKLYARFKINQYQINYYVDSQLISTTPVTYDQLTNEPAEPTKVGYTFTGWYTAETAGIKWDFTKNKMPANEVNLYARYTVNQYTVTFDNQGTLTDIQSKFGELITEPTAPTKAGYRFDGWVVSPTQTKWNFTTDQQPAKDMTLVATFKAENQTITFDVNSGDMSTQPADIVQVTDSNVNLDQVAKPTKAGYTFVGWFNEAKQVSGTIKMPAGGLELKAKWTADDQVIHFNTNGGGGVASLTAKTDSEIDLDEITTTRPGYTFKGWKHQDTAISGKIKMPAGGFILDAQWQAEEQEIHFDVNGGDMDSQPETIKALTDSDVDMTTVTNPTRAGYSFTGWTIETIAVGESFKVPAGGAMLIAQWTADDQTITFDIDGGESTSQPTDIIAPTDSTVDLNSVTAPTRPGFQFMGWSDGTIILSGEIPMPAGGLTLKAVWKDLIAEEIWKIQADDLRFTTKEVDQLKQDQTLASEILARSQAKAWNDETGEQLEPIDIDMKALAESSEPGKYQVTISHTPQPSQPQTRNAEPSNESILKTDITVTVVKDEEKDKSATSEKESEKTTSEQAKLPSTGEITHSIWFNLLGGTAIIAAFVFFIRKSKKTE